MNKIIKDFPLSTKRDACRREELASLGTARFYVRKKC